jgi:20S proteasome alpha/beta subunit
MFQILNIISFTLMFSFNRTTIVGIVFKGGICLGADTRATGGSEVADKNCEKIHYLADNIYCCGAGTAADTEKTTELISSQLELHRLNTGMQPRVVTAVTLLKRMLFRYQGHVSAALVLGGCDLNGPHLYHIYPHGSTGKLPYVTMGSGSLAAMSVFECGWKEDMTEEEAIAVIFDAFTCFFDFCQIALLNSQHSFSKCMYIYYFVSLSKMLFMLVFSMILALVQTWTSP